MKLSVLLKIEGNNLRVKMYIIRYPGYVHNVNPTNSIKESAFKVSDNYF